MNVTVETDVLIIGGGYSGCRAAIRARELGGEVALVDKGYIGYVGQACMTHGDLMVMMPDEDFNAGVKQFVTRGMFLSNQEWVEILLRDSYPRFRELLDWGIPFARPGKEHGQTDYHGWGGKLYTLNVDGQEYLWKRDGATQNIKFISRELMPTLRKKALKSGVRVLDHTVITDLLKVDGRVIGAVGLERRTGDFYIFKAKATVIAGAGAGAFKAHAQGRHWGTGDGIAMAYKVGAEVMSMEFALIAHAGYATAMEANFSTSGNIVNRLGEDVRSKYKLGPDLSMALEVKEGRGPIFCDYDLITPAQREALKKEGVDAKSSLSGPLHVLLAERYFGKKLEEVTGKIPVVSTLRGTDSCTAGIRLRNTFCETTIPGLYAAGDGSGTFIFGAVGAHDGGRPMAHAGMTGYRAGNGAMEQALNMSAVEPEYSQVNSLRNNLYAPLKREQGFTADEVILKIQENILPYDIHMILHEKRLKKALGEIERIQEEFIPRIKAEDVHELVKAYESKSIALNAEMCLRSALLRQESRGEFYREDYPERDDKNWLKWILLKEERGKMNLWAEPIPFEEYNHKP